MNPWFLAAIVLVGGLVICGLVILKAPLMDRLVALNLSGILMILIFVLLAQGSGQSMLYDLALTLAVLALPGILVFIHFLERWL
jgi:multisubunit Na+/H+ antiporter MnhF subunit